MMLESSAAAAEWRTVVSFLLTLCNLFLPESSMRYSKYEVWVFIPCMNIITLIHLSFTLTIFLSSAAAAVGPQCPSRQGGEEHRWHHGLEEDQPGHQPPVGLFVAAHRLGLNVVETVSVGWSLYVLTVCLCVSRLGVSLQASLLQIVGYRSLIAEVEKLRREPYDCENAEHESMLMKVKLPVWQTVWERFYSRFVFLSFCKFKSLLEPWNCVGRPRWWCNGFAGF